MGLCYSNPSVLHELTDPSMYYSALLTTWLWNSHNPSNHYICLCCLISSMFDQWLTTVPVNQCASQSYIHVHTSIKEHHRHFDSSIQKPIRVNQSVVLRSAFMLQKENQKPQPFNLDYVYHCWHIFRRNYSVVHIVQQIDNEWQLRQHSHISNETVVYP